MNLQDINTMNEIFKSKKHIITVGIAVIAILIVFIIPATWNNKLYHSMPASAVGISVTNASIEIGQSVTATISLNTNGASVNSVGLYIDFDPAILSINSISTTSSFCTFYIDRSYDNIKGVARLFCGAPTPGFSGQNTLETITFTPLTYGHANIAIDPKSIVLANDGKGTNLLKTFEKTNVSVILSE